jgi:hypothetical protein
MNRIREIFQEHLKWIFGLEPHGREFEQPPRDLPSGWAAFLDLSLLSHSLINK